MKSLRRTGIWGMLAVLLVLLASIPVVWAMPEQDLVNQSIPTRTAAPAPIEPVPTPVLSAPISRGPDDANALASTPTPDPLATPRTNASSGQSGDAQPPTSTSPDAPLPPLFAPGLFPGAAPLPEDTWGDDAAGNTAPASQSAHVPAREKSPADGYIRGAPSALRWLFPNMTAPRPLTFAALLGIGLLFCGAGLLVFSKRRPTE